MLIDEYLLSNPIFDPAPLIFNALNRIASDSLFFFNVPLFELFKVVSVDDLLWYEAGSIFEDDIERPIQNWTQGLQIFNP